MGWCGLGRESGWAGKSVGVWMSKLSVGWVQGYVLHIVGYSRARMDMGASGRSKQGVGIGVIVIRIGFTLPELPLLARHIEP